MTEYFNTESMFVGSHGEGIHDLIIQGLNQSLDYGGRPVHYPVEPFASSQDAWNSKKAVYVPDGTHIPTAEFNADPIGSVKKYGGTIVGDFQNTAVQTAGKARLQSQAFITEKSVDDKILSGDILVSSAFNAGGTNSIEGPVIPSYVLLFDRDKATPRDKSTMFLNSEPSEDTDMADEAVIISELTRDLKEEKSTTERLNTEAKGMDGQIVELTGTVERLNSEAVDAKTENESLKTQLTEFMNAKSESDWNSIKATLPPGLVAKPEDEKALRELMNTDVHAYTMKIMSVARPDETKKEGTEYTNTGDNVDLVGIHDDWNAATGGI